LLLDALNPIKDYSNQHLVGSVLEIHKRRPQDKDEKKLRILCVLQDTRRFHERAVVYCTGGPPKLGGKDSTVEYCRGGGRMLDRSTVEYWTGVQ
jgi:hypothetical protein